MKKILWTVLIGTIILWSCKKDESKPAPSGNFFNKINFKSSNIVRIDQQAISDNGEIMAFLVKYDSLSNPTYSMVKFNATGKRVYEKNLFILPDYEYLFWDDEDLLVIEDRKRLAKISGSTGEILWVTEESSFRLKVNLDYLWRTSFTKAARLTSGIYVKIVYFVKEFGGGSSVWLFKLDTDGKIIDFMDLNDYFDFVRDVVVYDNKIVVFGDKSYKSEFFSLITNSDFSVIGNDSLAENYSLISSSTTLGYTRFGSNLVLLAKDEIGNTLYNISKSIDNGGYFNTVAFTTDRGVIGGGFTKEFGNNSESIYFEKYDGSGNLEWSSYQLSKTKSEIKGIKQFGTKFLMIGESNDSTIFVGLAGSKGSLK